MNIKVAAYTVREKSINIYFIVSFQRSCVLKMCFGGFVVVFLSMIQTEADRTADAQAFANRTLQSYCPYMNFCHRNATRQPDFIDNHQGPCCLPCSCDDDCVELENCCPDKDTSHIHASPLDCRKDEVKPGGINLDNPLLYRVVDKSPENERNLALVQKCRGNNRMELSDYIWVSDTTTGKIFRNRYCANCHGVDKFESWNIKTKCIHTFPSNINSFANLLVTDPACSIINVMPDYLANVTWKFRCIEFGQSNCEKKTTNVTLVDACNMYNLPVQASERRFVFRNVFCQLCVDPLWEPETCFSIANFFGTRTETSYGFLLDFRNLDETDTDRLRCDVDSIFDIRSVCIYSPHIISSKPPTPHKTTRPGGYKTLSMLNSTEHEISTTYKNVKTKIPTKNNFLALSLSDVVFIVLINVKMLAFNIYEQD